LSYFAEPNFIVYDDWFDYDLEKTKVDIQNKKIKKISNVHEYFYEQSNYKIGASENNFQLNTKIKKETLITSNYPKNISEKYTSISNRNNRFFEKLIQSKLKFHIKKRLIYSLSIFGFIFILTFLIFFTSHSRKSESSIFNRFLSLEKEL
jgi:hypothetical protein